MGVFDSFKQWFRKSADKLARRFYEGPEPPPRLFDEVEIFEKLHPDASVQEWRMLALGAIANAYRDGYVRGFEHKERLPQDGEYEQQKWIEAEAHRHDWSIWQGLPTSHEMRTQFEQQRTDPFAGMSPEQRAQSFAAIGQHTGEFCVVWPGEDDPTPWRKEHDPNA